MREIVVCYEGVCKEAKQMQLEKDAFTDDLGTQIEQDLLREDLREVYRAMYQKR